MDAIDAAIGRLCVHWTLLLGVDREIPMRFLLRRAVAKARNHFLHRPSYTTSTEMNDDAAATVLYAEVSTFLSGSSLKGTYTYTLTLTPCTHCSSQ